MLTDKVLHLQAAAAALLVGIIWGATNPFIKRGSLLVESQQIKRQQQGQGSSWQCWLSPSLCIPWLVNQLGSVVFVLLLGQADISMAVPVANAVSIAANAVVSVCVLVAHASTSAVTASAA